MARPLIVLDTNALFDDPTLSSVRTVRLLNLSRRSSVDLAIPEVVLRELQRQHGVFVAGRLKQLREVGTKVEASIRAVGLEVRHFPFNLPDFDALASEELLSDIFVRVRERLHAARVEILPLPDVDHQELLDRDLSGTLPFAANGKGYRDALIWHSIVERWPTTPPSLNAYIVTNDTDFGTAGLADELVAELPPGSAPVVVASIADLLALGEIAVLHDRIERANGDVDNDDIDPSSDAELLVELRSRDALQMLNDAAQTAVNSVAESLSDYDLSHDQRRWLDLPSELMNVTLTSAVGHGDFDWVLSDELDGETLLGMAYITAEVELQAFVRKSDAAVLAEPFIEVEQWKGDEAEVVVSRSARLGFELRVDVAGMVVQDVTFASIE